MMPEDEAAQWSYHEVKSCPGSCIACCIRRECSSLYCFMKRQAMPCSYILAARSPYGGRAQRL